MLNGTEKFLNYIHHSALTSALCKLIIKMKAIINKNKYVLCTKNSIVSTLSLICLIMSATRNMQIFIGI